MTQPDRPEVDDQREHGYRRRHIMAIGAGAAAAAFAGCASQPGVSTPADSPLETTNSGSTSATTVAGGFRLLISDQPVAIDEFDSLDVSFDRARVFRSGEGDEGEEGEEAPEDVGNETDPEEGDTEDIKDGDEETNEEDEEDGDEDDDQDEAEASGGETPTNATTTVTPTGTVNGTANETVTVTESDAANESEADPPDDQSGFTVIDLGGATVDLTQVLGEKAMGVFEGELPAGRYTKIELYAASVEGVVGGERVDVKIPSGKLQIVKPFEVVPGETLTFVFDINVVKKGQSGGYNLLPVISESGVAGQDVPVTVVGNARQRGNGRENDRGNESESEAAGGNASDSDDDSGGQGNGEGQGGGPPDDAGPDE